MHRVAILIDAQNISAKHWPLIHGRATSLGTVSACRVFGTFVNGGEFVLQTNASLQNLTFYNEGMISRPAEEGYAGTVICLADVVHGARFPNSDVE